ncbi:hypothetical protein Patl1_14832 [Pistacia atlantica]|uniref:Uncharacterized protein n=1 Tax=Pistacia atlantica TaxID=434234 RepID=A0ACC1AXM9_9ROSI|nr:hypothetical protein Patl1_14832 [Pistacia atlantica]
MGAIGATEMMLKGLFHGSLLLDDTSIERRPYHRNCSCALHKLNGGFSAACSQKTHVSFPKKVERSSGGLIIATAAVRCTSLKRNVGAAACSLHKNVSFTKKQPWNLCSLHVNVIASHEDFSSQSSLLDPSSSIGNVQDSKEIITFN